MALKEARELIAHFREVKLFPGSTAQAAIILDDRITELEAEVKRLEGQLLELNTLIQNVY